VCRATRRKESWGRAVWAVLLMLVLVELGCVGLWAMTGSGVPLLAALAAGLAIVYLVMFSRRY
jgi:hypothetical protein